jgi:FKBP-type peptidyl-prolyl cis-trans isomerase FkpA
VRQVVVTLAVLLLVVSAGCSKVQPASGSDGDVLRAIGYDFGRGVTQLDLSSQEQDAVRRGMEEGLKGSVRGRVTRMQIDAFVGKRRAAGASREAERGKVYAEAAAKEPGAIKLDTGVVFRELAPGTGPVPQQGSRVSFHFKNSLIDGTVLDDSVVDGKPAETVLGPDVLPCWSQVLTRMKAGGKAKAVCPASETFGPQGRPPAIPPGATLVFELELLEVH